MIHLLHQESRGTNQIIASYVEAPVPPAHLTAASSTCLDPVSLVKVERDQWPSHQALAWKFQPWIPGTLRTAVSLDLFAMGDLSRAMKPQGTKLPGHMHSDPSLDYGGSLKRSRKSQ